jgi:uncharacterized coiled-coil DUF342 family protein
MEEKKYEAGRVEISSAEYRDLVTEAVEARREASEARSEKWRLESENSKLKKELDETCKRVTELENIYKSLHSTSNYPINTPQPSDDKKFPWLSDVIYDCNKEGNQLCHSIK